MVLLLPPLLASLAVNMVGWWGGGGEKRVGCSKVACVGRRDQKRKDTVIAMQVNTAMTHTVYIWYTQL